MVAQDGREGFLFLFNIKHLQEQITAYQETTIQHYKDDTKRSTMS